MTAASSESCSSSFKASIQTLQTQINVLIINEQIFIALHFYRQVPTLKQKIAGKSPPTEKFAIRKARRYKAPQLVRLPVPVLVNPTAETKTCIHIYAAGWLFCSQQPLTLRAAWLQEMMYMWNGFSMICKQPELTEGMMQTLVEAERTLLESPGNVT